MAGSGAKQDTINASSTWRSQAMQAMPLAGSITMRRACVCLTPLTGQPSHACRRQPWYAACQVSSEQPRNCLQQVLQHWCRRFIQARQELHIYCAISPPAAQADSHQVAQPSPAKRSEQSCPLCNKALPQAMTSTQLTLCQERRTLSHTQLTIWVDYRGCMRLTQDLCLVAPPCTAACNETWLPRRHPSMKRTLLPLRALPAQLSLLQATRNPQ